MQSTCKQCGKCCQNLILPFKTGGDEQRWLELHGIKIIRNDKGEFIDIPLKCTKLINNKCSIYQARPYICRAYQCNT